MDGCVEESMIVEIEVCLLDKWNNIILLEDIGWNVGLEVVG